MIDPWRKPISCEENRQLVKHAYLAPAIQSPWQIDHNYIPCRIFKNISYGSVGITNNPGVNALFDNLLVCDRDPVRLFYKSIEKIDAFDFEEIKFLRNEVKTKHTYVNRISDILACLP